MTTKCIICGEFQAELCPSCAGAEVAALRKRLEEARRAAINYRNCADNYLLLSDPFDKLEATHRVEYDRWLGELDAALAKEEKADVRCPCGCGLLVDAALAKEET